MKVVKLIDRKIGLKDFEEKLKMKFNSMVISGRHLKLASKDKHGDTVLVYLRCEDMKKLFGLDINIFDEANVVNNNFIFKEEIELHKGKMKLLEKIFK